MLVAGVGLLSLVHRDLGELATRLVLHTHLNPASHEPRIFIAAASDLQSSRLRLLAIGAAAYAALRFLEAYGLFRQRPWAELLAAASGAVYVPFELLHLVRRPDWLGAVLFLANLGVVALMVRSLLQRRRRAV